MFYSHLPAPSVSLWLGERDGEAVVESECIGVLLVSQDTQGIGVSQGTQGIGVLGAH